MQMIRKERGFACICTVFSWTSIAKAYLYLSIDFRALIFPSTGSQYYHEHHDYITHHRKRQQGPRVLTVFLYLNDVEGGGGTRFTNLEITVEPKRGRALVWPSVLDDDPTKVDRWTQHEALPVTKGEKYAANSWIHIRDFKTPFAKNCAG